MRRASGPLRRTRATAAVPPPEARATMVSTPGRAYSSPPPAGWMTTCLKEPSPTLSVVTPSKSDSSMWTIRRSKELSSWRSFTDCRYRWPRPDAGELLELLGVLLGAAVVVATPPTLAAVAPVVVAAVAAVAAVARSSSRSRRPRPRCGPASRRVRPGEGCNEQVGDGVEGDALAAHEVPGPGGVDADGGLVVAVDVHRHGTLDFHLLQQAGDIVTGCVCTLDAGLVPGGRDDLDRVAGDRAAFFVAEVALVEGPLDEHGFDVELGGSLVDGLGDGVALSGDRGTVLGFAHRSSPGGRGLRR